jgi:hypothetical protein
MSPSPNRKPAFVPAILVCGLILGLCGPNTRGAEGPAIKGLTGEIDHVRTAVERPRTITALSAGMPGNDIDLKRMAQWAMSYLGRTPRKELNYEPVFQCSPLRIPVEPPGHDVVVPCDTDARLNWEWYYMRDITGSDADRDIEAGFHRRLLSYVQEDGTVLAPPGAFNETEINKVYRKEDEVIHVWGATKIMQGLVEDYRRTRNGQSLATAKKIMRRLHKLAVYPDKSHCYIPCGMGAMRQDGTVVPNFWNIHPAPILVPLVNLYLVDGDPEALEFAKAYAAGIVDGSQPGGIRFGPDGAFDKPELGHSHGTMHTIWGIALFGAVTGNGAYVDFARRAWEWMLGRGTGTGWFPAMPDDCSETCLISDMMSIAALIARQGRPEFFDYVERYMRNVIVPAQFVVTPEFEAKYRAIHAANGEGRILEGLRESRKFQGGFFCIGLNDYENELLGGAGYVWKVAGCCSPEGMRAIYTAWTNVIDRLPDSKLGPAGVYVNMSFSRESPWGEVVSYMPDAGRLTVKAGVRDSYFLRPPHWAPREDVRAFIGTKSVPVRWSGDYVRFDSVAPGDELTIAYPLVAFSHRVQGLWHERPQLKMTYEWLGNMVTSVNPPAKETPIFTGRPRLLPAPPK